MHKHVFCLYFFRGRKSNQSVTNNLYLSHLVKMNISL
nr:MAG TPA: hypothetical protein [Caudoviricetes sp.]